MCQDGVKRNPDTPSIRMSSRKRWDSILTQQGIAVVAADLGVGHDGFTYCMQKFNILGLYLVIDVQIVKTKSCP